MAGRYPQEEQHEEPPKGWRGWRRGRRLKGWRGELIELVVTILIAFALVFGLVKPFVAEGYEIPSGSMIPTLEVGDRVLANKFIYRLHEPNRGDIVVFDVPGQSDPLIKRVVGLPGDEIQLQQGKLFVNGVPQDEPYVADQPCVPSLPETCSYGPVSVPSGEFFAMGDNRANSEDSRFIGPVPEKNIEGEAFVRYWPPSRIGPL